MLPLALALLVAASPLAAAEVVAPDSAAGGLAQAAPPPAGPDRPLIVGTKEAAPFAMKSARGRWRGISIDLWEQIAAELGVRYEYRETSLDGLLDGLRDGTLDVSIAALTITAAREQEIDFTHPYYISGLAIAVAARPDRGWGGVASRLLSPELFKVVLLLAAVLLAAGLLVWLFERRANVEQFGGGLGGIAASVWWSAVTMTTVGYGDKAPRTTGGRTVAVAWMFTSVIVISSFTAAITSSLTVTRLQSEIDGPGDLGRVRVGMVRGTTGQTYLEERSIDAAGYDTAVDALRALDSGRIDALVYDAPILRYRLQQLGTDAVRVLPLVIQRDDYGIALPAGSPLREPINGALLRKLAEERWADVQRLYLGE